LKNDKNRRAATGSAFGPRPAALGPAACLARLAGPQPGGPAQPRRRPATRGNGAGRRQGVTGEHRWGPWVAPGKKNGGGAHRGGRATMGRREVAGAVVFWWEGGSGGVAASSEGPAASGGGGESGCGSALLNGAGGTDTPPPRV
jgi:hypothetical protein